MNNSARDITIPSADGGAIPAYLAMPAVVPAPVLVMVAAVMGVDAGTREWVDRYAAHGFITVAPDFFWRVMPGPLNSDVPGERERARERSKMFDRDAGVRDIAAVRDYMLALPESNGKWSVSGYCFGGRYTLVAGADLGADAVIGFHPSRMTEELDAAGRLSCPASYHFGGADESIPMTNVEIVQAALKHNPRAETYVYPDTPHGFTGQGRANYRHDVAELSFERALRVLDGLKTVSA